MASHSQCGEIQQQQDRLLHVLGKNFVLTSPINISTILSDLENDRIQKLLNTEVKVPSSYINLCVMNQKQQR